MTFDEWWNDQPTRFVAAGFKDDARDIWEAATKAERERICAAIKAEDDYCADGDYMMDSDDCIKVVRGTWKRTDWNASKR